MGCSPGLICCLAMSLAVLWWCAHRLLGHGFRCLLSCPSLSSRLVGSLLPYGSQPSRWGHPCGVEAGFILYRNEGLVCSSFPFGLFLRVAPALRDLVTIRVKCVGRFPLVSFLWLSVVLSPLPFWMGLEPLSEASLRALSLQARFLVVLAEAESWGVLGSLQCSPLSDVMVTCPPPCLWLTGYRCPWCFALDPSGWGSSLGLRLLFAPCSCRRVLSWWSSLRQ